MKRIFSFAKAGLNNLSISAQLIILAGIILRLPLLFTPLTFADDVWRQADTASIAHHFYVNGYQLFYPQIYWGGNGPGYVEAECQLYPYLVAILYYFLGENYWLGKLVSLLFSVLAWWLFYRLALRVIIDSRTARCALAFLVFSPLYLRYSVAFMPEATVMFFYIAALFFFEKWISASKKSDLVLCAVCTAFAILVKPTSIHIGLVFALIALNKWGTNVFRRWEIWGSILIALIPGVLFYAHARNLYLTYGNTFGLFSGGDSKFGNLTMWLSPNTYISLINLEIKWILGIAIIPFIIGVVIAIKKRVESLVVVGIAVIGLYYLIVARYSQGSWGIQYHVFMLPFAALAIGLGLKWIFGKYDGLLLKGILWLSLGIFLRGTLIIFRGMLFPGNDELLMCAAYVKELVPANNLIIASTTSTFLDNGIENNYQEPEIFFYSQRYGWSLPVEWHTAEKVDEFRKSGAAYFVIYSQQLLNKSPSLADYLKNNSMQIGPGIESGCAVYRFDPSN